MPSSVLRASSARPAPSCCARSERDLPAPIGRRYRRSSLPAPLAVAFDARSASDLAHTPALEVAKRLGELLLAVHHEGPVVRHTLAQRLSREKQQPRLASAQPDGVARPEHRELPFGQLALTHARRALEYVRERILIARHGNRDVGSLVERPVLVDDRRLGVDDGFRPSASPATTRTRALPSTVAA